MGDEAFFFLLFFLEMEKDYDALLFIIFAKGTRKPREHKNSSSEREEIKDEI